jgi:hypothetical protein
MTGASAAWRPSTRAASCAPFLRAQTLSKKLHSATDLNHAGVWALNQAAPLSSDYAKSYSSRAAPAAALAPFRGAARDMMAPG